MAPPPGIRIRPITLQDADQLGRLLRASYPLQLSKVYSKEELDDVLPLLITPSERLLQCETFYVADCEGELVGCGGWTRENPVTKKMDCEESGHLRHFGTHDKWRGKSIATSIFTRCLADMKSEGIKEVKVCATLSAKGFYERMGFGLREEGSIPIGKNGMRVAFMHQVLF